MAEKTKDKIKLSFEIDRFKLIGKLARNCETEEEYNEMMAIIDRTNEVVRSDKELEDTNMTIIIDQIFLENPGTALWKRLHKEREEEDQETSGDENGLDCLGAVKIEGDEAKEFLGFIKKLISKHKEK